MKITRIERSKHKKGRILLYSEEGALLRVTENELLRYGLQVGAEIDEKTAAELQCAGKRSEERAYAAGLAGRSLLSRKQLCEKLAKRELEQGEIEGIADWLTNLGALDDRACAEVIVRHYGTRGYGRRRVEQELCRRGIPRELWEEVLEQLPDPDEAIEAYIKSKQQGHAPTEENCRKWAAALERRGFAWSDIRPVLNRIGQEMENN